MRDEIQRSAAMRESPLTRRQLVNLVTVEVEAGPVEIAEGIMTGQVPESK